MKISKSLIVSLFLALSIDCLADGQVSAAIDKDVWQQVSRTVVENDIVGMAGVYHPDAVLVSQDKTYPIASALTRWGEGMEKMQSEGSSATVSFKFGHRQDNDETAFESGIFRYVLTDSAGAEQLDLIAFEALLVKKDGQWKIMMERQVSQASEEDWSAL